MAKVKWTDPALIDIENIRDFYLEQSPKYSRALIENIFTATERLETMPLSGRIVPEINIPNIREVIYRNYRIIYWYEDNKTLEILAVFHSSRQFGGIESQDS